MDYPTTFDDWWALRAQTGAEDKSLALDAWFAAARAYNTGPREVSASAIAHAENIVTLPVSVGLGKVPVGAMIVAEELLRLARRSETE